MSGTRFVSLLGLAFGDCGKGLFIDALCRRWPVSTVMRFNGGAQAGHNVVLSDGRAHTFSQFSAGTFVPGVMTVLAAPVVVHPTALLVEHAHLESKGVGNAFERLMIDRRCRINTPFHQAAGRLREILRGTATHGTCGVGVGETVKHALAAPEHVLTYGDFPSSSLVMQKLEAIRHDLLVSLGDVDQQIDLRLQRNHSARKEWHVLLDSTLSRRWLAAMEELLWHVPPTAPENIAKRLTASDTVLLEGAQGVLLDEWYGFHPHTTWSTIRPLAAETAIADYCPNQYDIEHLGVLRTYLTRHGAGPLPTHDPQLDALPELHNASIGWQGTFRRGHPDAVLLRYALDVTGPLYGLLISHLDVFSHNVGIHWCDSYQLMEKTELDRLCIDGKVSSLQQIKRLDVGTQDNLLHQSKLTSLLFNAVPNYLPKTITSPCDYLDRITTEAQCPVWFGAFGQTSSNVISV